MHRAAPATPRHSRRVHPRQRHYESQTTGIIAMNHVTAELDQVDEDILNEVSDETLEAAAGTYIGGQFMMTVGPTIMMG